METPNYKETLARADPVLQAVSDGVTVQDATGRLVYANDAAARICGFDDARAMLGASTSEILARLDVRDELGRKLDTSRLPGAEVLAGEHPPPVLVNTRENATGRRFWSIVRSKGVRDQSGRFHLVVNVWHEVTDQQRKKESARFLAEVSSRLAASLEYEETLASVADALVPELADWVVVDLFDHGKQRRIAASHVDPRKRELARMVGEIYPLKAGQPGGVLNVLQTGRPELYPVVSHELLRRGAHDDEHFELLRQFKISSVMIVPIVVEDRTVGTITIMGAESGRHYDEDDLELAMEIARRSAVAIANARAYRAAKDAARLREEFITVAGHELRTPLAALQLQLESVKSAADSGALVSSPEKFAARLDKAFANVRKLTRLIDGLLDVSRLSSGRLVLERAPMDLAALVRAVAERFAEPAQRAGCDLRVDADMPVSGRWDSARLDQVLSNLVSNAIKYGAGEPVRVRCALEDGTAVVTVEDEGIGIQKQDRERIFGRFERAVSERNYGGLGLGLWIAREIVREHGGTIKVEGRRKKKGAFFRVALPVSA